MNEQDAIERAYGAAVESLCKAFYDDSPRRTAALTRKREPRNAFATASYTPAKRTRSP